MRKEPKRVVLGFTIIELLISLVLLITLAAGSLKVFRQVSIKAKVSQTQALLHLLEYSIEQYAIDNEGSYPLGGGDLEAAQILFQELAGYTPEGVRDEENFCYAKYLTLESPLVGNFGEITDYYGHYIRYLSPASLDMKNTDFDLWSIGMEEVTNLDANSENNIQN